MKTNDSRMSIIFIAFCLPQSHGNKITHQQKVEEKYQITQQLLKQYERPFTMLEIGTKNGEISFKAAHDYPDSVFVMMKKDHASENSKSKKLLELCKENSPLRNIILLDTSPVLNTLQKLGTCEHFDISFVHYATWHLSPKWKETLKALFCLGDYLIIELPSQEKRKKSKQNEWEALEQDIHENSGRILEINKQADHKKTSILYLLTPFKTHLEEKTWLKPPSKVIHEIKSNFRKKKLIKKQKKSLTFIETSEWKPGINLITFKMCQGVYPPTNQLQKNLNKLEPVPHQDWMPNNMIVQGKKMIFIDFLDQSQRHPYSKEHFNRIYEWIALDNPNVVEREFWKKIVKGKGT